MLHLSGCLSANRLKTLFCLFCYRYEEHIKCTTTNSISANTGTNIQQPCTYVLYIRTHLYTETYTIRCNDKYKTLCITKNE